MLMPIKTHWRHLRRCCSILLLLAPFIGSLNALAEGSMSLQEATRRVLEQNPELEVFQWKFREIEGSRRSADLAPAVQLSLEAENLLGSGDFDGYDSGETTLSLSSVIELGDKRRTRVEAADARYANEEARRQAQAMNIIAKANQIFIAALALQEKLDIAEDTWRLAENTLALVTERTDKGAISEAEGLRAQAAVTQARLAKANLQAELKGQKFALASLWGAKHIDFSRLSGDLYHFDSSADFNQLYADLANSPAVQIFASEAQMRDAELALVQSQSGSNVQWSLGLRRFEESGDTALTAGVSIPLFSGQRNRGDIEVASAKRDSVYARKQAALNNLRARLFQAWQSHQASVMAARQYRTTILPTLKEALQQTRQAYQQGRYSYADWTAAQREVFEARLNSVDAAANALQNQVLIEQLTRSSLSLSAYEKISGNANE